MSDDKEKAKQVKKEKIKRKLKEKLGQVKITGVDHKKKERKDRSGDIELIGPRGGRYRQNPLTGKRRSETRTERTSVKKSLQEFVQLGRRIQDVIQKYKGNK